MAILHFYGRRTDGGDGELQTSVYPSNFAPIAAKLRQRAFQTICNFRFFDAKKLLFGQNLVFFILTDMAALEPTSCQNLRVNASSVYAEFV